MALLGWAWAIVPGAANSGTGSSFTCSLGATTPLPAVFAARSALLAAALAGEGTPSPCSAAPELTGL